jgi:hypothetical protein
MPAVKEKETPRGYAHVQRKVPKFNALFARLSFVDGFQDLEKYEKTVKPKRPRSEQAEHRLNASERHVSILRLALNERLIFAPTERGEERWALPLFL